MLTEKETNKMKTIINIPTTQNPYSRSFKMVQGNILHTQTLNNRGLIHKNYLVEFMNMGKLCTGWVAQSQIITNKHEWKKSE